MTAVKESGIHLLRLGPSQSIAGRDASSEGLNGLEELLNGRGHSQTPVDHCEYLGLALPIYTHHVWLSSGPPPGGAGPRLSTTGPRCFANRRCSHVERPGTETCNYLMGLVFFSDPLGIEAGIVTCVWLFVPHSTPTH